eukprot:1115463-Pyramimonas_sp.AAC.1
MRALPTEPEYIWGHETCDGSTEMGGWDAGGLRHWGLRWSPVWGHEACDMVRMAASGHFGTPLTRI